MSTRPNFSPYQVCPNAFSSPANGSMAGNIITQASIIQNLSLASYDISWAGSSPVGTISLEGSDTVTLYPNGSINNPGNWNLLPVSYNGSSVTAIPISGNTGNGIIDVTATGIYAVRLIYTFTSGTGTLTAVITAKAA